MKRFLKVSIYLWYKYPLKILLHPVEIYYNILIGKIKVIKDLVFFIESKDRINKFIIEIKNLYPKILHL